MGLGEEEEEEKEEEEVEEDPCDGNSAHSLVGEIKTLVRVFLVFLERKLQESSVMTVTVPSLPSKTPARHNWWVSIYRV